MWEIYVIRHPKKVALFSASLKAKKASELTDTQKGFLFMMLLYYIWIMVGLLSSQWVLFLFFVIISFIPKKHFILRLMDGMVSVAILVFIMINAYHLHIDLFALLFK
jgi:hypothetical protein